MVVCWLFQLVTSCLGAERAVVLKAGWQSWPTSFKRPSGSTPSPEPGTCPTAGGGETVDRGDRRDGTAAQSIAPATPATAGVARRLWALARLDSSRPHTCACRHHLACCCWPPNIAVAKGPFLHGYVHPGSIMTLTQSTCSVVKIEFSSHRAAVGMRGFAAASEGPRRRFSLVVH